MGYSVDDDIMNMHFTVVEIKKMKEKLFRSDGVKVLKFSILTDFGRFPYDAVSWRLVRFFQPLCRIVFEKYFVPAPRRRNDRIDNKSLALSRSRLLKSREMTG